MVRPEQWTPSEGIDLEPNAFEAVIAKDNYLVVAGPGAGKTELLAQRANYLLETNLCVNPRRILAISFKRDAADNLRKRVESRVGPDLGARFDSHTFDSFGKSLLDRFREGLTDGLRPAADFDIVTDFKSFAETTIRPALHLVADSDASLAKLKRLDAKWFLEKVLCSWPMAELNGEMTVEQRGARAVWLAILRADPCLVTFDMVKRLAEHIIHRNPLLAKALRVTYSHVFLDEYQDTTAVQYDLLRKCFPTGSSVMTAVGDNKQRIMLWANAMPDAFERFEVDYSARPVQLLQNRRSDARLVEIQKYLINAIDPDCEPSEAAANNMAGDGICEILLFADEQEEAHGLLAKVRPLLVNGTKPGDICILARQTASKYVHSVITVFKDSEVKCRLEEPFQVLLKDDLVEAILNLAHLSLGLEAASRWQPAMDLICLLEGYDPQDELYAYNAEERLLQFLATLKEKLAAPVATQADVNSILNFVLGFLQVARIRAHFPRHQNVKSLRQVMRDFSHLLFLCLQQEGTWQRALYAFYGRDCIPIMTIHKSKGLEYFAVLFIGLEDSAWWNFAKQGQEETCAFFVAFSRAKKEVYFTFCQKRSFGGNQPRTVQRRESVGSLYKMLTDAGVEIQSYEPTS